MKEELEESMAVRLVWWRFPPLRNALLAALVAGATYAFEVLTDTRSWPVIACYVFAIVLGGMHWAREGLEKLISEREVGIEMLMIAATVGSAILGMWEEAAALVVLYGAAEGVEEYTYVRARSAIRKLLDLAPKEARLVTENGERIVKAEELQPGDCFIVRPGEGIITDGRVIDGRSSVNEAPVTGESIPVEKTNGSLVFAGSINAEGALTVEATKAFADNTLSKIIHLVEQAQDEKGNAQKWIERFGRRYSPLVLLAAALLFVIPALLGLELTFWSERAIVLLVAAAPCALIMSMPMAMAAGIGAGGRRGILIKGGAHLEHLGRIETVAFDKTGTLTVGKPAVTDVVPLIGTRDELISTAAGIEQLSQHPLARAIVAAAKKEALRPAKVSDFQSVTGGGVRSTVDGQPWVIGSPTFIEEQRIALQGARKRILELQSEGKTVVVVATLNELRGLVALQDEPRPEAAAVIRQLQQLGVRSVMLSGDNTLTAEAIARQLGIDFVRAELKPEDKVRVIKELEQDGPVLMIGDGVNDAPALASATCGAAMGVAGTDAAIEAADIALMADDLRKLPEALALGKRARRISAQNIIASIAVLAAMIPMAVFGLIGVTTAVLVHEVAELLAVANGLRAGRIEGSTDPEREPAIEAAAART